MKCRKQIKAIFSTIFLSCLMSFCNIEASSETENPDSEDFKIIGADISSFPEIRTENVDFFDLDGNNIDFLQHLKDKGINTIRLRLWVNPESEHCGFDEVRQFCAELKEKGFKIWLSLHYSDTWADPGQQITPKSWQGISFSNLKDSVSLYTAKVVSEIKPDYVQIGNEINSGFLHPSGNISTNFNQFSELLDIATQSVRENSDNTKIIIHYAGFEHANFFFEQIQTLDYDIIGISYYPIWHGKSLTDLELNLNYLSQNFNKQIVIAETAYPFSLGWNDWTTNILGSENQIIMPDFPASPEGQRNFILDIKHITTEKIENGIGFCYWGGELVAWKGNQATNGSAWENQALFDFDKNALPVLDVFGAPNM